MAVKMRRRGKQKVNFRNISRFHPTLELYYSTFLLLFLFIDMILSLTPYTYLTVNILLYSVCIRLCLQILSATFPKEREKKIYVEGEAKFLWEFFICVHFYFMQFEQKRNKIKKGKE